MRLKHDEARSRGEKKWYAYCERFLQVNMGDPSDSDDAWSERGCCCIVTHRNKINYCDIRIWRIREIVSNLCD